MSLPNDIEAELRFVQALQRVFGLKCRQFDSNLRGALRQLYDAAHADGVTDAMCGARPAVKTGEVVEHFGSLQDGMLIQNDHLANQGQARKILQVPFAELPAIVSVLVDVATGTEVGSPTTYNQKSFEGYSPYRVIDPAAEKKGAA